MMIQIDGSHGEGGGQILRTLLSLSLCGGVPFTLRNIRRDRNPPGLIRPHIACLKAVRAISDSRCEGALMGSQELRFWPGTVRAGTYEFSVHKEAYAGLVLQTVLWPLLSCSGVSTLTVREAPKTSPGAPPLNYVARSFIPVVATMHSGVRSRFVMAATPGSNSVLSVHVDPEGSWFPLRLDTAGAPLHLEAEGFAPLETAEVASATLKRIGAEMGLGSATTLRIRETAGPQLWVNISARFESLTHTYLLATDTRRAFEKECQALRCRLEEPRQAPVDEYLADQLLLPLALGAGGRFRCSHVSQHMETNIWTIGHLLPFSVDVRRSTSGGFDVTVPEGKRSRSAAPCG